MANTQATGKGRKWCNCSNGSKWMASSTQGEWSLSCQMSCRKKKYTCEQLEQFTFGQAVERVPMLHATWSAMEMNRNTRARKQSNRRSEFWAQLRSYCWNPKGNAAMWAALGTTLATPNCCKNRSSWTCQHDHSCGWKWTTRNADARTCYESVCAHQKKPEHEDVGDQART